MQPKQLSSLQYRVYILLHQGAASSPGHCTHGASVPSASNPQHVRTSLASDTNHVCHNTGTAVRREAERVADVGGRKSAREAANKAAEEARKRAQVRGRCKV